MSSNWVNALDACAAAGVIDYDAPAFISGKTPRYIGHPEFEKLPLKNDFLLPKGIKMKDLLKSFVFAANGRNKNERYSIF